jgi:hypothetical protein
MPNIYKIDRCRRCLQPVKVEVIVDDWWVKYCCKYCHAEFLDEEISSYEIQTCPECENKFYPVEFYACNPPKFTCNKCYYVFSYKDK